MVLPLLVVNVEFLWPSSNGKNVNNSGVGQMIEVMELSITQEFSEGF